jgi:alpha-glucosidase
MKSLVLILVVFLGFDNGTIDNSQDLSSGKLVTYNVKGGIVTLRYENLVSQIEVVNDGVIHFFISFSNKLPLKQSYAVVNKKSTTNIFLEEERDCLKIHFEDKEIKIKKGSHKTEVYHSNGLIFSFNIYQNKKTKQLKLIAKYDGERFFGLGEKTGNFELTGRKFTMYNSDTYKYTYNTDPLYASIPFYIAIKNKQEYGVFFDSPAKSLFSLKRKKYSYKVDDGMIDFYIFTGDTKKIIQDYTTLTGKPYFPPLWSFGFHQSRNSYTDQEKVLRIANNFREYDIPLDALYLDIGFMKDNLVFTYDSQKFPHPKNMIKQLNSMGIKTVAIVDPGIKVDKNYSVYQSGIESDVFCKCKNCYYEGKVWPGMCHFPDFTKESTTKWWGNQYKYLLELGIEGFWNDMNEPSIFSEPNGTMPEKVMMDYNGIKSYHRYLHNIYGLTMAKATFKGINDLRHNKRIFLLTRAAYSGIQRYAFLWTGDNTSNWEHLRLNVSMALNLGLSGVPYVGADIGGYTGSPSEELFTRWIQLSTFIPFMRCHTEPGTRSQEPYVFKKNIDIIRKYIKMRYKLLPYLYTEVYRTQLTGLPIAKSLFLEYGENYLDIDNIFLFGRDILVAPVLKKGITQKEVTLPEGIWYDLWTDKVYKSGKHSLDISIEDIPVFVKAGSIIPLYDFEIKSTGDFKTKRDLTLRIYPDKDGNAQGFVYEDDGETLNYREGVFLITKIEYQSNGNIAKIKLQTEGKFRIKRKIIFLLPVDIQTIKINGKKYSVENRRVEVKSF